VRCIRCRRDTWGTNGHDYKTDPHGMPTHGKLEDDAFVPVQDDPSKAVTDFRKLGKSLFREFDERKRASVAVGAEVRSNHPKSQASHQNRRRRNPTPPSSSSSSSPSSTTTETPRPDHTIHFHRYTAETGNNAIQVRSSQLQLSNCLLL